VAGVEDANPPVLGLDSSHRHSGCIGNQHAIVLAILRAKVGELDIEPPPLVVTGQRLIEVRDVEPGRAAAPGYVRDGDPAARKPRPTVLIALFLPAVCDDGTKFTLD